MMGQSPRSGNYTDNPDDYILVQGNADLKKGRVSPRVWTTQVTKTACKGDIIICVRAPVGDVAKTQFDVVIGRGVASINGNDFLLYLLNKMKLAKFWTIFSTGSTFESINSSDLKDAIIGLPNKEEQSIIGKFFKQLDKINALHQRKLDALKRLKEAYVQNIFPKKGQSRPKLRFANFSEDWEQRKLGELADTFSGGTPSAKNKGYYKGNIPFIRSGEINATETELFISDEALKNSSAKLVNVGDILYALYGATSGEVGISKVNGAINQAILSIKPRFNDNTLLIAQWLKKQKEIITNTYLQGGQGNLSGSIVKNLMIDLPFDKKEQTNIGNLLKKLDDTITLHQRKLDQLQKLKEAYLQKLFV